MTPAQSLADALYRMTAPAHDVRDEMVRLIEAAMTTTGPAAEHVAAIRQALTWTLNELRPTGRYEIAVQDHKRALASLDAIAARLAAAEAVEEDRDILLRQRDDAYAEIEALKETIDELQVTAWAAERETREP